MTSIPLVSTIATVLLLLLVLAQLNSVLPESTSKGVCRPSGILKSNSDEACNQDNDASCCNAGEKYPQFSCSPPVTKSTPATMTLNSFRKGGDGGGQSKCDEKFHSDGENVVALSTGWYDGGSRCSKNIRINANGRSVLAKVVDECDSVHGCDSVHDNQPPCPNNIVDASPAVWKALKIPRSEVGLLRITWSDV